jgi:hypothetical protein
MRANCERCAVELPFTTDSAMICSHECTFCALCADELGRTCPNCGGELVRRPRRIIV